MSRSALLRADPRFQFRGRLFSPGLLAVCLPHGHSVPMCGSACGSVMMCLGLEASSPSLRRSPIATSRTSLLRPLASVSPRRPCSGSSATGERGRQTRRAPRTPWAAAPRAPRPTPPAAAHSRFRRLHWRAMPPLRHGGKSGSRRRRGSAIIDAKNSARRESGPRRPARDGVVMADLLQKAHNSRQRRHFDGAAPSSSGGHVDGLPASSPAIPFSDGRVSFLPTPPPKRPPSGMTPRPQDGRFLMRPGYCPPRFECCVAAGLPPPLNSWEGGDDSSTNCGLPWGTITNPTTPHSHLRHFQRPASWTLYVQAA